jgi:hypothetical protein
MLVPLLFLLVTLVPMLFLNRWISRHIQGLGLLVANNGNAAVILYFVIMLPGILVHELSHWLMARLLGLRTGKLSIGPSRTGRGKVRLGSVRVSRADPLRESLVGVAPLLAGCALVLLLGSLVFDLGALLNAFTARQAGAFLGILASSLKAADFWLWLYIIFAVSNAMLPSESDRQAWLPLALFLGGLTLVLLIIGWAPRMPAGLVISAAQVANYLALAFLITLVIDLGFLALIAGLEWAIGLLSGRRINSS